MAYEIYRVVAVTNEPVKEIAGPPSLTSFSYCTPQTRFWLTTEGLEDPNATVILACPVKWKPVLRVTFEYDGGEYIGTLEANQNRLLLLAAILMCRTLLFRYVISPRCN